MLNIAEIFAKFAKVLAGAATEIAAKFAEASSYTTSLQGDHQLSKCQNVRSDIMQLKVDHPLFGNVCSENTIKILFFSKY